MSRKTLVVLGSGFAAFSFIRRISTELYDVTLISPRNHFLFTPLLPGTTVGTLEFRSIIEPIRGLRPGIRYFHANCTGFGFEERTLACRAVDGSHEFKVPYDALVIAVGAAANTYGIPGVHEHALFLRELADARAIRQRLIDRLERASLPGISSAEVERLLHFVVVGGGPTGVELAAEMHDFLKQDLAHIFPHLRDGVRITLLEATDQILNSFDSTLSAYTLNHFRRQGIIVRTHSPVASVGAEAITLKDGTAIPYGMVVWATGNGPIPLVGNSSLPTDHGRIITNEFFEVKGYVDIYAIGDCATIEKHGLPATGQVAQQQGKHLASILSDRGRGLQAQPFHYRNLGMLAYIGGARALADLASFKGRGYAAWLFWRSAYLTRLVSLKNKLLVLFDWFKARLFGRDVSRF